MKFVTVIVTGVAVLLVAGSLFPSREALGQSPAGQFIQSPGGQFIPSNQGGFEYASPAQADPELAKLLEKEIALARETAALTKEYAATENEENRAKIKAKLGDSLGKQFDLQQKRRDVELTRLEAQMKKLRDVMKKRSDARTTIVDKRLDQVLREADGLGWSAPRGLSNSPAVSPVTPFGGLPYQPRE
jgi:hypothetical protein